MSSPAKPLAGDPEWGELSEILPTESNTEPPPEILDISALQANTPAEEADIVELVEPQPEVKPSPQPPPAITPPPAPSPPLSVREVQKLLQAGISEGAILAKIRRDGLDARPTPAELGALREAGASDLLIRELLAAAIPAPPQVLLQPAVEFPMFDWPPVQLFPGLWPFAGWTSCLGRWPLWVHGERPLN